MDQIAEVEIAQGLRVRVITSHSRGGEFTGKITYVGEHILYVLPDSQVVRRFLGGNGTYPIGKAHWRTSLTAI